MPSLCVARLDYLKNDLRFKVQTISVVFETEFKLDIGSRHREAFSDAAKDNNQVRWVSIYFHKI